MKFYHSINLKNFYRTRVCELLDNCMKSPLISIEAGTGFGKSIAVNQYLTKYKKDYILMRLNHLDNIPEQFWLKYTQTIGKLEPDVAEELRAIGFPSNSSEINSCLHVLAKHLHNLKTNLCFILDGFHLITEPSILFFFSQVFQLESDYLRMIIISMHKHHLDLTPFFEAGTVSVINKDDLVFTRDEIRDYFMQLEIPHDAEIVQWVYIFSEGWAFVIKLVAFFLKNDASEQEIKDKVLPTIFELMGTYAFDSYTQKYKDALIVLSFLHTIPIRLVMAISGLDHEEIVELARSNAFIRYDEGAGTIELHKIYLKFLKSKKMYITQDNMWELFLKSADWYYDNGYVYDAIAFYRKCHDYDKICEIIREFKNKKLSYDTAYYLLTIIGEIPQEVITCYRDIPLYEAMFFFNNNNLELAQDILRGYETELLKADRDEETEYLLGETYLLLGLIRVFMREIDFHLYFNWAAGKLPEGSRIINQTFPLLEINHGLLCKSLEPEDINMSLEATTTGFEVFTKLTHGCGAGLIETAYGEYEFLRGNFKRAEAYLYEGLYKAEEYFQADIVLIIYYQLFRIGIARGNSEQALEYINKIKRFNEQNIYPRRDYPLVDIALAWFSLKIGSEKNIAPWILKGNATPADISKRNEGRNLTLYANWLLSVKKHPIEALAYIDKIEKMFIERNLYTSLVYLYQLKYAANKMLGKPEEEYFIYLELIYDMIHESDLIMFLVESGSAARSALITYRRYEKRRIPDEWLDRVLTKSITYAKYMSRFRLVYQKSMDCVPEIEITDNEKALLEGLCAGLSRTELAEENQITENTVKSQLRNLYNKLDATNQAEAVYIYTSMYLTE